MTEKNLSLFIAHQSKEMPTLFQKESVERAEYYDDYILIECKLPCEMTFENLMDELDCQEELVMMYHQIPSDDTLYMHNCCFYSNPAFGKMYKINAHSDDNNHVDSITVTIYSSLEVMCVCLKKELQNKTKTHRCRFALTELQVQHSFE